MVGNNDLNDNDLNSSGTGMRRARPAQAVAKSMISL